MALKKIINNPDDFVDELTESLLLAHPDRLRAASPNRRARYGEPMTVVGGRLLPLPLRAAIAGLIAVRCPAIAFVVE